jgi:hypothetical protein
MVRTTGRLQDDLPEAVALAESELTRLPIQEAVKLVVGLAGINARPHEIRDAIATRQRDRRFAEIDAVRLARTDDRLTSLFAAAFWPDRPTTRWISPTVHARDVRMVDEPLSFFSAKLAREVLCESQVELTFFEMIERSEQVLTYQEQPVAIPYEDNGYEGLYHPDAAVTLATGMSMLVEIKPWHEMASHRNLVKWRAATRYAHSRGVGFLVTDTRRTLRDLLEHSVDPRYRATILQALTPTPLSFFEYKELLERVGLPTPWIELVALVLQDRLRLEFAPFRLSAPAAESAG